MPLQLTGTCKLCQVVCTAKELILEKDLRHRSHTSHVLRQQLLHLMAILLHIQLLYSVLDVQSVQNVLGSSTVGTVGLTEDKHIVLLEVLLDELDQCLILLTQLTLGGRLLLGVDHDEGRGGQCEDHEQAHEGKKGKFGHFFWRLYTTRRMVMGFEAFCLVIISRFFSR